LIPCVAGHEAFAGSAWRTALHALTHGGLYREREAIEALGLPVLGALPKSSLATLPERHLGLVQAGETADLDARLDALADFIAEHAPLEAILACAAPLAVSSDAPRRAIAPPAQRIAIARDAAFSFIYPHLLRDWRAAGAEIAFFSPLADEPPPADAGYCYLPGGYPELHAGALAGAARLRAGLHAFAQTRLVHGECGGYMALGRTLTDAAGVTHPMAGLLDVETTFAQRAMNLGYRHATLTGACALGAQGAVLRGHEFHYARVVTQGADEPFALVQDAHGGAAAPSGSRRGRVTGAFFHAIASG